MKVLLRVMLGVLMILYPLLVYMGLQHFNVRVLALLLLAVALVRFTLVKKPGVARSWGGVGVLGIAILIALLALVTNQPDYFLFYPVVMNLALLGVFVSSLIYPPSAIERLARLQEPDLPASGVIYTRKVTVIWSCFFAINGVLALYTTLFCSLETWTLYNGLIAYIAMGVLFAGEYAIRTLVVRR